MGLITRFGAAAAVVAAVAVGLALPAGAQAGPRENPILFVHSYQGSEAGWGTFKNWVLSDYPGTTISFVNYGAQELNVDTAKKVQTQVSELHAATGRKVDIITHSMGVLSARRALKDSGTRGKVSSFVSLAGPNHGVAACWAGVWISVCAEMKTGSAFLTSLNSGDETPGSVKYLTVRLSLGCDVAVPTGVPLAKYTSWPTLTGTWFGRYPVSGDAVNVWTPCTWDGNPANLLKPHGQLAANRNAYVKVRDFLNGNKVRSG